MSTPVGRTGSDERSSLRRGLRSALAAVVVLVVAVAAGCGGEEDDSGEPAEGETRTVDVGTLPAAAAAPMFLGIEKGFFEDEGLKIRPHTSQGGAEVTAAVVSGDNDIGFGGLVPVVIAGGKGLPIQIVAQGGQGGTSAEDDWAAVMVAEDGPVKEPKDLEGETVAVNALASQAEVTMKGGLAEQGVDVSKVRFVEIPFPEMTPTLQSGDVAAIAPTEPFVSVAREAGARVLMPLYASVGENVTVAAYFTTKRFAEENGEVLDRFVKAINRSLEYAQDHPEETRGTLDEYTTIPPPVAKRMQLPTWGSDLNKESIEKLAELSKRFGLLEDTPDVDELVRD